MLLRQKKNLNLLPSISDVTNVIPSCSAQAPPCEPNLTLLLQFATMLTSLSTLFMLKQITLTETMPEMYSQVHLMVLDILNTVVLCDTIPDIDGIDEVFSPLW